MLTKDDYVQIRNIVLEVVREVVHDEVRKIVKEEIAIALKPVYKRLDKIERNMKTYTRFFDGEIIEIRKKLD